MVQALIGFSLGVLAVWLLQRLALRRWGYTLGLMFLPLPYVFFAWRAGDPNTAVIEFFYGFFFLASGLVFAISRLRFSAYVLAALWLAHAGYDLAHGEFLFNMGMPAWYPLFCAAFDVVFAGALVWLGRTLPEADIFKS